MKKLNLLLLAILVSSFATMFAQETSEKKVLPAFKPTVAIHGRIQADIEYEKFNGEDKAGFEFRRLYLSASGNIFTNLKYKAQIEFAQGGVGFRDVYIKAVDLPYIGGNFIVGNYANPTGLDAATSSKYITFLERALITNTQGFRWTPGFFYENYGLLDGKLTTQLAYTFNGDNTKKGFTDKALHMGSNITARITGLPYKSENNFFHVGLNYEFINTQDDTYKLSLRPETHMSDKMKLKITDVKMQNDLGVELATAFGPFSFSGEYERSMALTNNDGTKSINTYYGQASFFLTKGDHRSFKKAQFGRTKPVNAISWNKADGFTGGLGAVELAVRYSATSFEGDLKGSFGNDADVKSMSNITGGLNWYLNAHTRFMYNYIYSMTGDNDFNAHTVRFAVDF